jgi:hypothetical protein
MPSVHSSEAARSALDNAPGSPAFPISSFQGISKTSDFAVARSGSPERAPSQRVPCRQFRWFGMMRQPQLQTPEDVHGGALAERAFKSWSANSCGNCAVRGVSPAPSRAPQQNNRYASERGGCESRSRRQSFVGPPQPVWVASQIEAPSRC